MKNINWSGKKWTDSELLEAIHDFYKKNGRVPRSSEFSTGNGYPSRGAYVTHFGSFSKGVKAAGYEPTKPGDYKTRSSEPYWTLERIFEAILAYQEKTGKIITDRKMKGKSIQGLPVRNTIRKYFGTVRNARLKAEAWKKLNDEMDVKKRELSELLK